MSETPDETQTETETPEEETPDTTPDAEPTPEEEEAEIQENEQQALARVKAASSAEIPKKIERAVSDQRKRLEKIVGVELEGSECPTCGGMGYTVGGADPDAEMVHPDNLVMCEVCNGYGAVVTGSRNPDHITAMCITCAGNGFITKPIETNVTPIYVPPPISAQQAQMGTMMPDGTFVPFGQAAPASNQ